MKERVLSAAAHTCQYFHSFFFLVSSVRLSNGMDLFVVGPCGDLLQKTTFKTFFLNIFGMKLWKALFQFYIVESYKCPSLRKFHGIMNVFFSSLSSLSHGMLVFSLWICLCDKSLHWPSIQKDSLKIWFDVSGPSAPMTKVWKYFDDFVRNGLSLWICFFFYCQPFSIIIKLIRSYSPLRRTTSCAFVAVVVVVHFSDSRIWIMNDNNGKNQSRICCWEKETETHTHTDIFMD